MELANSTINKQNIIDALTIVCDVAERLGHTMDNKDPITIAIR